MAAAGTRRRKVIGQRRRVEDEAEDEGGPELADLDDDSVTDGSIGTDEHDPADDSDTSNIDDASPTSPNARKPLGNGHAKPGFRRRTGSEPLKSPAAKPVQPAIADAESMLSRLSLADKENGGGEMHFDDIKHAPPAKNAAPIVVSSSAATQQQPRLPQQEVKRREHEEYRRRRDEDPTFVPNRGAFFLHDHRHAGPAANGFRPFPRGARGRGRGTFGNHFAPITQVHNVPDPVTNGLWKHDMHEVVAAPQPPRQTRYLPNNEGPPNGNGVISTAPTSQSPINRAMSTEKHIGNTTIRVFIPSIGPPKLFPGVALKQYTKLPDHRPPLRRDKPVRISIPYHDPPVMPRYIFPASDRSFIFIPRAMRPNQQRTRGKGPRSVMGSGVFSRGTSVWGGSVYGSMYSPSIALSRRSSIAPDIGREFMLSPTGSAISRPPLPVDTARPVVRLPPLAQPPVPAMSMPPRPDAYQRVPETSINELPQPQMHPLPQKPAFQESRANAIPMHQPRPQKTVSVENIEPPVQPATGAPQPYQQAFHQQVPPQLPSAYAQDSHVRHPSFQSQFSSSTPLSQIPERAVHAAPFQPNTYAQPGFYNQPYASMQPQQGFYYPQVFNGNMGPNATAPAFVPAAAQQQAQPVPYAQPAQGEAPAAQPAGQGTSQQQQQQQNMVDARESQGTVYYDYYAAQAPPMPGYPPPFPGAPQPYTAGPGMVGMAAAPMMTPSPDTFYYQQPMVYYPQ
ncbi:CASC3/Barentsz eIF4AIII binding-domain-containing protein [Parachaetomium inaequale]|uniref:CASC3/Barentsz eIF4AIII binding-domain-containing protein n=1 Tax=Parachaetomium inaequale TaxID=2588326 RepID=A0AAN6PPN6_9PEZI|nr:CASC3/Barentsz eIF4AIII binding-domain-containing protein [Parachaetomium inaequale]